MIQNHENPQSSKAPWRVEKVQFKNRYQKFVDGFDVVAADGTKITSIHPGENTSVAPEIAYKNALVIAASAALLEELKDAVARMKEEYPEHQWADYGIPDKEKAIYEAEQALIS